MAFPNLPGVTVNLNDLGLKISPPPAGPKVTLLGVTSNTGIPVREPFLVTNAGLAASSLWFSGSNGVYPGELAMAMLEAFDAGAEAVEIVVIGHYSGSELEDMISPTGTTGHVTRYNDLAAAYDAIKNTQLDVVVPVGARADDIHTSGNFAKQLANFCYQATKDIDNACVGVISMMTPVEWAYSWSGAIASHTGVSSSLSGEVLSIDPSAGDLEFGEPSTELITEWHKYATQTDSPLIGSGETNFPGVFRNYLAGSEDENGVFYPENDENAATDVNSIYWTDWQALDSDGSAAVDLKGNKVDAGARICIVGGPLVTTNKEVRNLARGKGAALSNTIYNTDGAAVYAGFITTLAPQSATTNKKIPNIVARKHLSGKQANSLAGRRITTFYTKPKGLVVATGITGAHNVSKYVRSDFTRLTTVRIVDAVIELVREIGDRFIGEPNTAAHRNAISAEIDKALNALKIAQALNDYEFFVSATAEQQVLGELSVDLTLVPAFEIVKINVTVSLVPEL
ncbi:MAG: hypothetical protein D6710_08285 [Nitrospirae bacterium]|nr:MAG: hypothetical protein D6710_08285 [Nitrospirota bacterium]